MKHGKKFTEIRGIYLRQAPEKSCFHRDKSVLCKKALIKITLHIEKFPYYPLYRKLTEDLHENTKRLYSLHIPKV
ncbi:hypothetical protein [Cytobacillus horneckiae]|uniref:Uncharacterized protein n=1 Tax=Cytobacillus horneckiae TaxID=549687 RepID=A0A2N0Z9S8_9BACI|nr:hypothetical protein [Cytobacillus horneckiae]MEC1158373.1 hypothetical protein [Cytobacillus horneckiae]MED2937354.1 hypothetical protein [Cytobacillus horneckiae]PKG26273.1 hypothetical protein CWS20_24885 [Cytobacillus horneckiae]